MRTDAGSKTWNAMEKSDRMVSIYFHNRKDKNDNIGKRMGVGENKERGETITGED